jgi:hypothetical protein
MISMVCFQQLNPVKAEGRTFDWTSAHTAGTAKYENSSLILRRGNLIGWRQLTFQ